MEFEQYVNFVNVEGIVSVTIDTRGGSNNLMIEVATSTGITSIIVMHPAVFNEMVIKAKDAVNNSLGYGS